MPRSSSSIKPRNDAEYTNAGLWRYCYEESAPAFDLRFLSSFANAAIGVMFSIGLNVDLTTTKTEESDNEIEAKFSENRVKHIAKNTDYIQKKQGGSKKRISGMSGKFLTRLFFAIY